MNKEDIMKLAENPRFIKGIYNYCDRWCERCPFTSRCMNYALGIEQFADQEAQDFHNDTFWKTLSETFQMTIDLLEDFAEREGIDLDSVDNEAFEKKERLNQQIARDHACCRAARQYIDMVDGCFGSVKELFEQEEDGPSMAAPPEMPDLYPLEEETSFEEAMEVVRWYQHQIYVKLMRAVQGEMGEDPEILDEFAKDSDGSAKVALIGIDRSIAAWGEIRNHFPIHGNHILEVLVHLERLRRKVEKVFPGARSFIRPGFDNINLNS